MCPGWVGGPLADALNDLRAWPSVIDGQVHHLMAVVVASLVVTVTALRISAATVSERSERSQGNHCSDEYSRQLFHPELLFLILLDRDLRPRC